VNTAMFSTIVATTTALMINLLNINNIRMYI
jgi:hypothetical protein